MKNFGNSIQHHRQQAGLSQQQLSTQANISLSTLSKIEQGKISDPGLTTVIALAQQLNTTIDELVNFKDNSYTTTISRGHKIEFIYCDVNGVLVRFFQRAFVSMAEKLHTDVNLVESAFWHYNSAVNKGEMSTQEFNQAVEKRLRVRGVNWQNEYMKGVEAVPVMHDCLRQAAQNTKIGLLTNIFPGFVPEMITNGLLPDLAYDQIIDSSEVGYIKPEAEIYNLAQQRAGVPGEKILFIDDSRTNLMEAERHGWQVLWFDDYRPEESVKRVNAALKNLS